MDDYGMFPRRLKTGMPSHWSLSAITGRSAKPWHGQRQQLLVESCYETSSRTNNTSYKKLFEPSKPSGFASLKFVQTSLSIQYCHVSNIFQPTSWKSQDQTLNAPLFLWHCDICWDVALPRELLHNASTPWKLETAFCWLGQVNHLSWSCQNNFLIVACIIKM